jgi:hypothetical protein
VEYEDVDARDIPDQFTVGAYVRKKTEDRDQRVNEGADK